MHVIKVVPDASMQQQADCAADVTAVVASILGFQTSPAQPLMEAGLDSLGAAKRIIPYTSHHDHVEPAASSYLQQ